MKGQLIHRGRTMPYKCTINHLGLQIYLHILFFSSASVMTWLWYIYLINSYKYNGFLKLHQVFKVSVFDWSSTLDYTHHHQSRSPDPYCYLKALDIATYWTLAPLLYCSWTQSTSLFQSTSVIIIYTIEKIRHHLM